MEVFAKVYAKFNFKEISFIGNELVTPLNAERIYESMPGESLLKIDPFNFLSCRLSGLAKFLHSIWGATFNFNLRKISGLC
jgi:hypothetical protein